MKCEQGESDYEDDRISSDAAPTALAAAAAEFVAEEADPRYEHLTSHHVVMPKDCVLISDSPPSLRCASAATWSCHNVLCIATVNVLRFYLQDPQWVLATWRLQDDKKKLSTVALEGIKSVTWAPSLRHEAHYPCSSWVAVLTDSGLYLREVKRIGDRGVELSSRCYKVYFPSVTLDPPTWWIVAVEWLDGETLCVCTCRDVWVVSMLPFSDGGGDEEEEELNFGAGDERRRRKRPLEHDGGGDDAENAPSHQRQNRQLQQEGEEVDSSSVVGVDAVVVLPSSLLHATSPGAAKKKKTSSGGGGGGLLLLSGMTKVVSPRILPNVTLVLLSATNLIFVHVEGDASQVAHYRLHRVASCPLPPPWRGLTPTVVRAYQWSPSGSSSSKSNAAAAATSKTDSSSGSSKGRLIIAVVAAFPTFVGQLVVHKTTANTAATKEEEDHHEDRRTFNIIRNATWNETQLFLESSWSNIVPVSIGVDGHDTLILVGCYHVVGLRIAQCDADGTEAASCAAHHHHGGSGTVAPPPPHSSSSSSSAVVRCWDATLLFQTPKAFGLSFPTRRSAIQVISIALHTSMQLGVMLSSAFTDPSVNNLHTQVMLFALRDPVTCPWSPFFGEDFAGVWKHYNSAVTTEYSKLSFFARENLFEHATLRTLATYQARRSIVLSIGRGIPLKQLCEDNTTMLTIGCDGGSSITPVAKRMEFLREVQQAMTATLQRYIKYRTKHGVELYSRQGLCDSSDGGSGGEVQSWHWRTTLITLLRVFEIPGSAEELVMGRAVIELDKAMLRWQKTHGQERCSLERLRQLHNALHFLQAYHRALLLNANKKNSEAVGSSDNVALLVTPEEDNSSSSNAGGGCISFDDSGDYPRLNSSGSSSKSVPAMILVGGNGDGDASTSTAFATSLQAFLARVSSFMSNEEERHQQQQQVAPENRCSVCQQHIVTLFDSNEPNCTWSHLRRALRLMVDSPPRPSAISDDTTVSTTSQSGERTPTNTDRQTRRKMTNPQQVGMGRHGGALALRGPRDGGGLHTSVFSPTTFQCINFYDADGLIARCKCCKYYDVVSGALCLTCDGLV